MNKQQLIRAHTVLQERYPDTIILIRAGAWYESLSVEPLIQVLGATPTTMSGMPIVGIPYHQLDSSVETLVAHGYRVGVVDETPVA